ncbi:uncharacterized protein VTP21DRAFT_252 [Calcarisporiella thermophila]|uniref:uncharacterized protein n=1 Tax=Calcarisporiella thermophila TaxID=911321 RepID=UPI00374274D9
MSLGKQTDKITCLLNWHATPYHAPVYLAQKLGYFAEEGIKVAILEPSDPSDVTEIIGSGKVDLGLKAMIHTIAAKAREWPVTSIGTLLDEPLTGVVYLKSSGITEDFQTLRGKRIGYVGEFGKIILDELTQHYGMKPEEYTAIRVGMNVTDAIKRGVIDAGVGLENVQQVELEAWCEEQGKPRDEVRMLRIDELAHLGCCCFCSILYIVNENYLAQNRDNVAKFVRAVAKATEYLLAQPQKAYNQYCEVKPDLASPLNRRIFERSLPYFSKNLENVERDWNKVTNYCKRLGLIDNSFQQNYTNEFVLNK